MNRKNKFTKGKVSVIIPVFNVAEYLEDCLKAVIMQTYKNLEIIVINDNSKDNSVNIINKFLKLDNRILSITNPINYGAGKSRNIGIEKATGEYLYFIDSDDIISHNYIETLLNGLVKYKTDISCSNGFTIYFNDKKTIKNEFNVKPGVYEINNSLIKELHGVVWNKMFKHSFIIENNIKFLEHLRGEDIYFTFLSSVLSKRFLAIIDNTNYYYRQRDGGIMSELRNCKINHIDIINVIELLYQDLEKYNLLEKFALPLYRLQENIKFQKEQETFLKFCKLMLKDKKIKHELYSNNEIAFLDKLEKILF